jgi:hypothetical protein
MNTTNDRANLIEILEARKYDALVVPKSEQVIFTIQSKIVGTLENYCVVSGLPKASKSTYIAAAIASALVPDYQDVFGIKIQLPQDRKRIAYFDTETSQYDFYRQMEKIRSFSLRDKLPPYFDAYNTREDSPNKIRALITAYLQENWDCSVIVIDGLLDLCLNYNDEVETRKLTNWFKKLTKIHNVLMIGVLHKGKGTGETLGHLGSNADRWAQSTLEVTKVKETKQFVLTPKYLRSSEDFDPVAIMNFDNRWQQVPYQAPEVETYKKSKKS